jgi:predicted acylesterase/phospholipase RssA
MGFKRLVLSGGGIGGFALIGAYRALIEHGYRFNSYTGTSIGAIFSLAFSLGYDYISLSRFTKYFDYNLLEDMQILGLIENLGLDRMGKIEDFLKTVIALKTDNPMLTFREHYWITGRSLTMTSVCVDTDETEIFNVNRTPDMPIYKAIMMSISIPVLLAAVKHNDKIYTDGGVHDPFPIKLQPIEDTIGVNLCNRAPRGNTGHDFVDFIVNLISGLLDRSRQLALLGSENYQIININTNVFMFDFMLDRRGRLQLIKNGYETVKNYLGERR